MAYEYLYDTFGESRGKRETPETKNKSTLCSSI